MRSFSLSCVPLVLLSVFQASHAASVQSGYRKVASAWYAGWHATSTPAFPVSEISWSKYTHMTYSFAETTPDVTFLSLNGSDPQVLPNFVSAAHKHGVKALVSVGGWTGSRWFSSNVGSAKNRTLFVKTVTEFAKQYHLDGLDFDWEYPAHQGIGCNTINPNDSANFLAFLEELRGRTGNEFIITAAAVLPFYGPNGKPSTNVAGFAKVLDWVAIMNYDIWGPWSPTVGPNAPLNDTCTAPANRMGSAVSFVKAWEAAGMPRDKIVLGVASYGHSFRVTKANAYRGTSSSLALYPHFVANNQPTGDAWDGAPGNDICGNFQGPSGNVDFWGLISLGYLNPNGTPKKGIDFIFDDCAKTAYVYNKKTEIMVSYDNAEAFSDKGRFIMSAGIRGFSMWEAGGDSNDILLNAIRGSMVF